MNEQKVVGWKDREKYDSTLRKKGDHGGHLAARSLGGPPEMYNLISQERLYESEPGAEWFEMERAWKDAAGKSKH